VYARRSVCADLIAESAEHLPDWFTVDFANQVPKCEIERPRPTSMKFDIGKHCSVAINIGWVLTYEILLVVAKPIHRIARADAASTRIVKHAHNRGRKVRAWNRVPGSWEWWI
jgi:hypothetical protein